jgi:hypothetical protein
MKTSWISLAHSLIHFSEKVFLDAEKASENVKKQIVRNKSHVWHVGIHPKNGNVLISVYNKKNSQINLD